MCELECQLECESGSCERCQRLHLSKPEMRAPSATRAPPRSQPRRRHARATRTHASRWLMCAASVVRWADTCGRTLSRKRLGGLLLVLTLLLTMGLAPRAEALQMPSNDYPLTVNDTSTQERKVCQSIDIRNSVSEFSNLQGCRIVEGFVQILLIERDDIESFNNISFPELVEITGYLMLYRVNGLRNLTQLFPNLSVIRGHSLFINYALVAFEMMNLQEIGLYSLTDIVRGAVHFEKNPALCFVDTIDWDLIARSGIDEHVIKRNNLKNVCPICDKSCPVKATQKDEHMCWNKRHCQKVCPQKCEGRACDDKGSCCHPSCIGGCSGPTNKDCKVCKDVVVGDNECVDKCPPNTYEFMNRRCITEDECRNMPRPRESSNTEAFPYKPFNYTCLIECPPGYMETTINNKSTCKQCVGQCLKACPAVNVDSVATAQKLRGCTHITGSLEIQVSGGRNVVKELEENLGDIEIIDGYLKVVRSFPLVSLNFLRNLKEIRGNFSDNTIFYTLLVLDNQNLMELWNWEKHPKIKIFHNGDPRKPGRVFFHFNPKLCLDVIDMLKTVCGLQKHSDDIDVSPSTNGDKAACNVTELEVKVDKKAPEAALIHWPGFKHHDPRGILGYVVYFIEAPSQNVTMYDGRDACGGDGWKVDDVSLSETTNNSFQGGDSEPILYSHIMTQLKPYTQYAFYVKTYTIASIKSGAQSKVQYFTTLPGRPNPPRGLSIYSNSSDSLVISWLPPLQPNGNLTYYYIKGKWNENDNTFFYDRDYCVDPMLLSDKKSMMEMAEEEQKKAHLEREMEPKVVQPSRNCDCPDREPNKSQQEKEVSSSIAFEDALHNQVYIKRTNSRPRRELPFIVRTMRRRDSHSYPDEKAISGGRSTRNVTEAKIYEGDKKVKEVFISFARNVSSRNLTYVMKNLKHFGAYNVEIQACRDRLDDPNDVVETCSTTSVRTYRTLPKENADDIPTDSFQVLKMGNNTQTIMRLSWSEPQEPNGVIVSYQIEYKRVDIQNVQPTTICIPRNHFENNTFVYHLKGLTAGNYSVRIRASSFAGYGAYTPAHYFQIDEYVEKNVFWTAFWITILILLVGAGGGAFVVIRKKYKRSVPSMRLIATVNPEYVSTAYVPDEWEVSRKKVQVLRELGNGSFGMVYEGIARNIVKGKPEERCAVKTVNEQATDRERIEFLNEASVMKAFNTHHVVRLLGVVSKGQPTLVVMELMTNGDLKSYLRSHRPDVSENSTRQPPTLKRILRMAVEIADGMCYLAAKKFVHRDLAARNCMVAEDLTVKIGDFGMTRDIYETDYYRKGSKGLLPVRWMAPESLKDGVFTSSSDVWSYGVVLWEMVTLASQPYQGLSNDQVLHYVIDGGVMERPENCPDSLYGLMRDTWNHKSSKRPTFIDIATILLQEVHSEDFERVSFYHSPEGIEARNQNAAHAIAKNETTEIEITNLAELQDLREEEMELEMQEEDSPLHPAGDGDFTSMVPIRLRNHLNSNRYEDEPERTDENSLKAPLKAAFDDFEIALGDSLSSSKDTLDLPYAEDSLKSSTRSSPCTRRQKSISPKSTSPQSIRPLESPSVALSSLTPSREEPDYENRSPEMYSPENDATSLKMVPRREFDEPEKRTGTLNNGYISGATAK